MQTSGARSPALMAHKKSRMNWREGNRIVLLHNGGEFFPALCTAIDAARSSVHLETYIFELDKTGVLVLDHLERACQRGIKVRIVIDGFGCQIHAGEICRRLTIMGAQHRIYRPEPRGIVACFPNPQRLRRLHRKVTVVDGRIAFVGGINIVDDLADVPDDGDGPKPRFDFAVRLEGPIVPDVVMAQNRLWLRMAWGNRQDWSRFYRRLSRWSQRYLHKRDVAVPPDGSGRCAALVLRDNVRYRRTIENGYLKTIEQARHEVMIANAYFFPGRRLRQALERAASRGVRVRLLLQGRSEYPMQYRACRSMYCKLFDEGIEVYEYMASYLHAKVAVIDSCAIVGSANLDPFSLLLAREANVFVRDEEFAAQLKAALDTEIRTNAARITEEGLRARTWVGRVIDDVAYRMLRIGVALTGSSAEY